MWPAISRLVISRLCISSSTGLVSSSTRWWNRFRTRSSRPRVGVAPSDRRETPSTTIKAARVHPSIVLSASVSPAPARRAAGLHRPRAEPPGLRGGQRRRAVPNRLGDLPGPGRPGRPASWTALSRRLLHHRLLLLAARAGRGESLRPAPRVAAASAQPRAVPASRSSRVRGERLGGAGRAGRGPGRPRYRRRRQQRGHQRPRRPHPVQAAGGAPQSDQAGDTCHCRGRRAGRRGRSRWRGGGHRRLERLGVLGEHPRGMLTQLPSCEGAPSARPRASR